MIVHPSIHPRFQEIDSLQNHLQALATLPGSEAIMLSVFLDLNQPLESLKSKFLHWCTTARITLKSQDRAAFDVARGELDLVFREKWPDSIRSVAAFSRGGDSPFLLIMPFSATLENHFHASKLPAIFPLVQMKDRFHRFVVAISTEESSRIYEVTLGAISEQILATRTDTQPRVGREWTREHYHQHKRENDRRFLTDQVGIITSLMSKRGHNHLILAGHPRFVNPLRAALPKDIESRVADTVNHAPNGQDCSAVLEHAVEAFIEVEQDESHNTVERLHEQVSRDGLAVVGIEATLEAMQMGAASELVISEELPIPAREELVKLATTQQLPIEVCEGDELLNQHGGVGALLRFRLDFLRAAAE